ncbi:MAG: sulfite oxidase heme-binding subunit YedZ [Candidatus Promineifilaceae bacterium]
MAKKATVQKSWVQEWEIIPGAIITLAALIISRPLWWFGVHWVENISRFGTIATVIAAVGFVAFVQSARWNNKQKGQTLRALTHFVALVFMFFIFWDIWFWQHLDSVWYNKTTFYTGRVAIFFLFLSLSVTPLVTLFDWKSLGIIKKPLGNYGFVFVAIHLTMFIGDFGFRDGGFSAGSVVEEAFLKNYALVGFLAFLLLVPLAVTSNKWSIKAMGKRWKKLHQLVYVINVLAVAHWIWVWSSKLALVRPISFALILMFLLFLRIKSVKSRIRLYKKNRRKAARAAA